MVSTFLKERDLAGLKVCSVSSSPSIVSVQSERGASCNSKLSHESPPGPALKHQRRAQDGASQGHAAETASDSSGDGTAMCVHRPHKQGHSWPKWENGHLPCHHV